MAKIIIIIIIMAFYWFDVSIGSHESFGFQEPVQSVESADPNESVDSNEFDRV